MLHVTVTNKETLKKTEFEWSLPKEESAQKFKQVNSEKGNRKIFKWLLTTIKISAGKPINFDLIMTYEQQMFNIPLAGDILDDLAMAFREIISKVGQTFSLIF